MPVSDSNIENPASDKKVEINRHTETSGSESKIVDEEKENAIENIKEKLEPCSKVSKGDVVIQGEINSDVKPETKGQTEGSSRDDIEENLQCIICQEIMHDCIR